MKPSCQQCRHLCSDLYDDDLSAEDRAMALEHLASCGTCRQEYRTLQSALGAVASLGDEHTGPSFDRMVMRRARSIAARERVLAGGRPLQLRPVALVAAAAILVVVAGGVGVWLGSPATPDQGARDEAALEGTDDETDVAGRDGDAGDENESSVVAKAAPDPAQIQALMMGTLANWGFVKQEDGTWKSPIEVELESGNLVYWEGKLLSPQALREKMRAELIREAGFELAGSVAAGGAAGAGDDGEEMPEREIDPQVLEEELRAYLAENGFVEKKGHWYSETESRLLEPGMACIEGRILTRAKLKEELRGEIFAEAGLVQDSSGKWTQRQHTPTRVADAASKLVEGDRYWAPEVVAIEGDRTSEKRIEKMLRDLGNSRKRGDAVRLLQSEGPEVVASLRVAYEASSPGDDRLACSRVLAHYGIETREIVVWIESLATYYQSADDDRDRAARYRDCIEELGSLGLMSGRVLERLFQKEPTVRLAELLSIHGHPQAEQYLLDAYLGRPSVPVEARSDVHEELVNWWLTRAASGEPEMFFGALALLNRSDERERLLGVHLIEAIAYRYPEWAPTVFDELMNAAEGSYCGCSLSASDQDQGLLAQLIDCRLHETVRVENVPTSLAWVRDRDREERHKLRSSRGSVVAADVGRVLTNLSGDKFTMQFKGERGNDAIRLREAQIVAVSNWRLKWTRHRDDYEKRWDRMVGPAAAFRDSELRAPWHVRNRLLGERTETRGNFYDASSGLAGMSAVLSDRTNLDTVVMRALGRVRGSRIVAGAGTLVPVDTPAHLPRSLVTSFEFYALGVPVHDALRLAVEPRGMVAMFRGDGLYIGPLPKDSAGRNGAGGSGRK